MTAVAGQQLHVVYAAGWSVPIPMPRFTDGPHEGEFVGWLNKNKPPMNSRERAWKWRAIKDWRLAAKLAYRAAGIPPDLMLPRVLFQHELRFSTNSGQETPNYEPTIAPIVDALQPETSGLHTNPKTKARVPFVDYGWGVIPRDNFRHIMRGEELPIGPTLGRKNPVKGLVIVHLKPIPPLAPH